MGLIIGIDTGGTFTDLVAFDSATGRVAALKTSSTPQSPGEAIVNALAEGEIEGSDVESFTHGTTVGTNALIERSGCKVAFLTTKGFEDTPYIQRINRKVLYDLQWRKPEPLVASRRLCLGVEERLDSSGAVVRAVDEDEVRELCEQIRDEGAEAVASLSPLLLRQHRARRAGGAAPARGARRASRSRSRTRSPRSGASTSGHRPRSPTPT